MNWLNVVRELRKKGGYFRMKRKKYSGEFKANVAKRW